MTTASIEVEEVITKTETYYRCDGCGTEIEDDDFALFTSDDDPADDLHFHLGCLDQLGALTKRPGPSHSDVHARGDVPFWVIDPLDIAVLVMSGALGASTIVFYLDHAPWIVTALAGIASAGLFFAARKFGRSQYKRDITRLRRKFGTAALRFGGRTRR